MKSYEREAQKGICLHCKKMMRRVGVVPRFCETFRTGKKNDQYISVHAMHHSVGGG
jgi:hypothetical protein